MQLEKILHLIADPDTKESLDLAQQKLINKTTGSSFYFSGSIPLLYSKNTDKKHLQEEDSLAKMMKRVSFSTADSFSFTQWNKSKKEFWSKANELISARAGHQNIINIGCGYDDHSSEYSSLNYSFVNFDLLPTMLEENLNKNNGGGYYIAGDMNYLPFKNESFDIVICIDVIHHEFYKLEETVKKLTNLLKPGGLLLLEDPNAWAFYQIPKTLLLPKPLYKFLREFYHKIKKSGHKPADYEFPTSPFKVKRFLIENNFDDIKFYRHISYPEVGEKMYKLYAWLAKIKQISTYFDYHYFLSAVKRND